MVYSRCQEIPQYQGLDTTFSSGTTPVAAWFLPSMAGARLAALAPVFNVLLISIPLR